MRSVVHGGHEPSFFGEDNRSTGEHVFSMCNVLPEGMSSEITPYFSRKTSEMQTPFANVCIGVAEYFFFFLWNIVL